MCDGSCRPGNYLYISNEKRQGENFVVTVQIRCYILAAGTPDERHKSGLWFQLQNGRNPLGPVCK